jgi:hypothetical protein
MGEPFLARLGSQPGNDAMPFDIHLHTCNLGTQTRKVKNPFTGEAIEVPIDPGLNQSERKAVIGLLAEVKAAGPDPDYYYRLTFSDGGLADIVTGTLDGNNPSVSFGIEIYVMTPQVVDFLFRLARAASMCVLPIMNNTVPILTSIAQDDKVCKRWPDAVVVNSADELAAFVARGYEEWTRYRDQIVEKNI